MKESTEEVGMEKCSTSTGFPKKEHKFVLVRTIINTKNILSTSMVLLTQHLGYSYLFGLAFSNAPDSLDLSLLHKDEKINLD